MIIATENLSKHFNDFVAVKDLNLKVEKGEIYGFLGPNGAGKTTTILMLLGILKPTRGKIYLFGQELANNYFELKRKIGVVSENQYIYPEMTAYEYLDFFGDFYEVKNKRRRIEELLERVDLAEFKNRRLGAFSRGMQQKLGFVRALLHDPELLILDEPISGLDPTGIREIRDLTREENERGKTIFMSSHLLSEVEKLCNRVGIINRGELLAEDRMENLKKRLMEVVDLELELSEAKEEIVQALFSFEFIKEVKKDKNRLSLKVKTDRDYRPQISEAIVSAGGIILGIKSKEMSLEDAFITITQENISLLAKEG